MLNRKFLWNKIDIVLDININNLLKYMFNKYGNTKNNIEISYLIEYMNHKILYQKDKESSFKILNLFYNKTNLDILKNIKFLNKNWNTKFISDLDSDKNNFKIKNKLKYLTESKILRGNSLTDEDILLYLLKNKEWKKNKLNYYNLINEQEFNKFKELSNKNNFNKIIFRNAFYIQNF